MTKRHPGGDGVVVDVDVVVVVVVVAAVDGCATAAAVVVVVGEPRSAEREGSPKREWRPSPTSEAS